MVEAKEEADTLNSDLIKELEEEIAHPGVKDSVGLALASELAGQDELTWFAEIMALPHWFDREMLGAMLPDDMKLDLDMDFIGQPFDYVQALLDLSFVVELPQVLMGRGQSRFEMDKAYRARLLKRWQVMERRQDLVQLSRRFRDYFRRRLLVKADRFEASILKREDLYHEFIANEREAIASFRTLFDEAESAYHLGLCQALVNLAQEQRDFFQEESTKTWLMYYQGRLNLMLGELQDARKQFERTLAQPYGTRWLRGRAQAGLADVSRAAGRWSQAMDEYEESLDILLAVQRTGLARLRNIDTRRNILDDLNVMDIRQQITEPKEQMEVARILTRMADLSLAMGQPTIPLAAIRSLVGTREEQKRKPLSNIIHQRLQAFAERSFKKAFDILDRPTKDISAPGVGSLQNLEWDIRYGLATVSLLQGRVDKARALYGELLTDQLNQYERAELMLAIGDCDVASGQIDDAVEQYKKAADSLQGTWDQTLWAKMLHRLGRAEALHGQWQAALSRLTESRQIYSKLGNKREEEKVQETLRELARYEGVPDGIRHGFVEDMAGWSAHHFAFSASSLVLSRVKRLWWPIYITATIPLAALYFYIVRSLGIWFLGLFGAERFLFSWWAILILFLSCWMNALIGLDIYIGGFRRLVGKLLPLGSIWGSQPELVTVDDDRFTQVDSVGQVRTMTWDEVTELRSGHSANWVIEEASLLSFGEPGGRTLLFTSQGALTIDASVNSYLKLDNLLHERVPQSVQKREEFMHTFRGQAGPNALMISVFLFLFWLPLSFVLTNTDPIWWMFVLRAVTGAVVAFFGIGFAVAILLPVPDAIRMRRFLYPRRLPDPPRPIDQTMVGSRYTEQERKTL